MSPLPIAAAVPRSALLLAAALLGACSPRPDVAIGAPETIQIDLGALLTSRLVITADRSDVQLPSPDQRVRPHPALMITATAAGLAHVSCRTLPDSGVFPATADHPTVTLPYGVVGTGMQVRMSDARTDTYTVPVPPGRYASFQLYLLSNNGRTPMTLVLRYADGSVDQRTTTVMDWFNPPGSSDPGWVVLAGDLGKVTATAELAEHDHHFINGFDVRPDGAKVLTAIDLTKNASSTELFLFGAAGVRTSPAAAAADH
jgi:hypothetical protein